MGGPEPSSASDASLTPIVHRLRGEVEGLRLAMRTRAIIEQAKGMLMERYGCGPEEAFDRLAKLSQHANIKLIDVASALVESSLAVMRPPVHRVPRQRVAKRGDAEVTPPTPADVAIAAHRQAVPRWPKQGSGASEFGTRVRAQARRTKLRSELLAARTPQDLVTAVAVTGLSEIPPDAAALAVVDVNGGVAVLGSHGIPAPVVARWRVFPIDVDLLVCAALSGGKVVWHARRRDHAPSDPEPSDDEGRARGGPPLGFGIPEDWCRAALLPLSLGDGGRGILALAWLRPAALPPTLRREIEQIAEGVASAMRRLPRPAPRASRLDQRRHGSVTTDPTMAVLDILLDPVLVCDPVLDSDQIVDLSVRHANPAAGDPKGRGAELVAGRSFLELFPESVDNGVFEACLMVLRTGTQADLFAISSGIGVRPEMGEENINVRITRYRNGVLIACQRIPAVFRDGSGLNEASI